MKTTSYSLLIACLVSLGASAQGARERSDLALVQRQFTAIEQFAERAENSADDTAGTRYRFDYPRLAVDLKRVREGIQQYLSPSRAQPADLVELAAQYRDVSPHSSPSNEHD